jgi:hypothetical protein
MSKRKAVTQISKTLSKAKMTLLTQQLFDRFREGGHVELQGKAVYLNASYRYLLLALSKPESFGCEGELLDWKSELETQENFTYPFSYYTDKKGEEKVSLKVKIPKNLLKQVEKERSDVEHFTVELKHYLDYPTPGKNGIYLELKSFE